MPPRICHPGWVPNLWDSALAAVTRLAGLHVLVELAGEMKAFEHELYRRGDGGGIFRPELLARSVERARLTDLTHIGVRRHHVRDVDLEPALENTHHILQIVAREGPVEHIEHRALGELAQDLFFARFPHRLELDLARGGGDHGVEVAHARAGRGLAKADGPLERAREEVLVVADAHAHGHSGSLADLR